MLLLALMAWAMLVIQVLNMGLCLLLVGVWGMEELIHLNALLVHLERTDIRIQA